MTTQYHPFGQTKEISEHAEATVRPPEQNDQRDPLIKKCATQYEHYEAGGTAMTVTRHRKFEQLTRRDMTMQDDHPFGQAKESTEKAEATVRPPEMNTRRENFEQLTRSDVTTQDDHPLGQTKEISQGQSGPLFLNYALQCEGCFELSEYVIEHAELHKEIEAAILDMQKETDQLCQDWKDKLGVARAAPAKPMSGACGHAL